MRDQNEDLFSGPRIRKWLPDETLYSLASRQHVLSGNWNPAETCIQLFGHPRSGAAHDFPSNIDFFCRTTNLELGSVTSIFREHTILPFYLPFCKPDVANNALASIRSGGIGSLKASLGLLATRFGCSHPLKSCISCMKIDVDIHGVAYWHLVHQFPGVWLCPEHETILRTSDVKSTGVGRFGWYLPGNVGHQLPWDDGNQSVLVPQDLSVLLNALAKCAIATAGLAEHAQLNQSELIEVYRTRSMQLDVMSPSGRIHHELFTKLLLPLHKNLKTIREFSALSTDLNQVSNQLIRMHTPERISPHPLRHFLLIIALFGSWSEFWKSYSNRSTPPITAQLIFPKDEFVCTKEVDKKREKFLNLILDGKVTISAASRACGIDTQTGIVWASMFGITVKRRPKMLVHDIRLKLITALKQGKDKKLIADKLSVSVVTVTNVLRSEAGLADLWHQVRHSKNQDRHRKNLSYFVKDCSESTMKDFRRFLPASFAWLYRNDRDWLNETSSKFSKGIKTNNSNIKWDARDEDLSKLVQNAGLAIKSSSPSKRVTIGQLCQRIPSLKPRLSQLKSLPLTRKAITTVIAPYASNQATEFFYPTN